MPLLNPTTLPRLKNLYGRIHMNNLEKCYKIIEKSKLAEKYKPGSVTILDGYPGVSVWSTALNQSLKPRQHILLEIFKGYSNNIKELIASDPSANLELWHKDPFQWGTFDQLIDEKIYNPPIKQDQSNIHPNFLYTANLTTMQGEQLAMQWLACVVNQNWIQSFGNVKMLLWVNESTARKLMAPINDNQRTRCSYLIDAFTNSRRLTVHTDSSSADTEPYDHDIITQINSKDLLHAKKTKENIALLEIDPKQNNSDVQIMDYVTKRIFVLVNSPLKDAFGTLGFGAKEYMSSKVPDLLEKSPRNLTVEDFDRIFEAYRKWPFKPEFDDFLNISNSEYDVNPEV